jgi:hypothetical protein
VAGLNQSDLIAELALGLLDVYTSSGLARQRVGFAGDGMGRLARFSGQTEEAVAAQLDGSVPPTSGQAVALIRALRLAGQPAGALNGSAQ